MCSKLVRMCQMCSSLSKTCSNVFKCLQNCSKITRLPSARGPTWQAVLDLVYERFVFTALLVVSDLVSFTVWRSWPQAEGNPSVAGFCGLAKWLHYRCGTKTNRRYCETTELTSPPFCVVANVKLCQTITVENNRKHHAPKIKSNTNNRIRGSVVSCMFRSIGLF